MSEPDAVITWLCCRLQSSLDYAIRRLEGSSCWVSTAGRPTASWLICAGPDYLSIISLLTLGRTGESVRVDYADPDLLGRVRATLSAGPRPAAGR